MAVFVASSVAILLSHGTDTIKSSQTNVQYKVYQKVSNTDKDSGNYKNPGQKPLSDRNFSWSRVRESNPPSRLGKPLYYRYTNPAFSRIIAKPAGKSNHILSIPFFLLQEGISFAIIITGRWPNTSSFTGGSSYG